MAIRTPNQSLVPTPIGAAQLTVMSQMNSKQYIALSILAVKEGKDFPNFNELAEPVCQDIINMIKSYDYQKSIEFISKTKGKSEAYKSKLLALSTEPIKAKEIWSKFLDAVRDIESSDKVLAYLPKGSELRVKQIRSALSRLGSS